MKGEMGRDNFVDCDDGEDKEYCEYNEQNRFPSNL